MSTHSRRLLIFAREPLAGRVKTRLVPSIGVAGATALYEHLLNETVSKAIGIDKTTIELWCEAGNLSPKRCASLASEYGLPLYNQQGMNLGDRMHRALAHRQPTPGQASVLIGSDCPGYTEDYLRSAFESLENHDAVIGPATDGGYVLIGVRRSDPRLFDEIAWGTDEVLDLTRARLRELGWQWAELATLRDIDRPSDLAHFPELLSAYTQK